MTQATLKVLHLPELATIIGEHLTPPHLLACVQVCRQLNAIFIPVLWRVINDNTYAWPGLLKTLAEQYPDPDPVLGADGTPPALHATPLPPPWIDALFVKYGRHIQHLTISNTFLNAAAAKSGVCTKLQSLWLCSLWDTRRFRIMDLTVPRDAWAADEVVTGSTRLVSPKLKGIVDPGAKKSGFNATQDWMAAQWFWILLLQNPGLVTLQLPWEIQSNSPRYSNSFLIKALQGVGKTLRQLSIHLPNMPIPAVLDLLPNVNTIYWTCSGLYGQVAWAQPLSNITTTTASATFPQVRTVMVGEHQLQISYLFNLLKIFPSLEQLYLWAPIDLSENWTLRKVKDFLDNTPHRLSALHFTNVTPPSINMEPFTSLVIPWLPRLTELTLNRLDTAIATALATHCPRLEKFAQVWDGVSIHPDDDLHIEVNVMGILLERCPNLKVFDGIQHKIEADYLVERPWVCRNLESLRCQIVGFNRLMREEETILTEIGFEVEADGDKARRLEEVAEKHKHCQQQHQAVYDRLASMTLLRTLHLGYKYIRYRREPLDPSTRFTVGGRLYYQGNGPIPDTMELSIRSGLDRLSSLTHLEVLDFEGVDHRVNELELEWMACHLPSLQVVGGLQEHIVVQGFEDPRVEELKQYLSRLNPRIRQEVARQAKGSKQCLQQCFNGMPLTFA
ncbi:hypothetical protein BGW39_009249 [Mortierella sp. 14UC]|nr:hypothetical protein BGW39_009249 [Mortierella sp. 14UC]